MDNGMRSHQQNLFTLSIYGRTLRWDGIALSRKCSNLIQNVTRTCYESRIRTSKQKGSFIVCLMSRIQSVDVLEAQGILEGQGILFL